MSVSITPANHHIVVRPTKVKINVSKAWEIIVEPLFLKNKYFPFVHDLILSYRYTSRVCETAYASKEPSSIRGAREKSVIIA